MEIIAKKNSSLAVIYFLGALACAFCAVYSFFHVMEENLALGIIEFIIFLFGFIFFVVDIIMLLKAPYIIITYEDGMLKFADGLQCSPSELQQVHYRRHSARRLQYSTGTLIVTVDGEDYKYRNVADVVEVQDRLIELMRQNGSN